MRDVSKRTEVDRGKHGVSLWALPRKDYEIKVIPDDGEEFFETFNTVSYEHARTEALNKFGPGHRIPYETQKATA